MRSLRFIALLAMPVQMAFGQQPQTASTGSTLTLDEAIVTAQRNNPAYLQVRNSVRLNDAQVRQAYGALLPRLDANFNTRYTQGGTQYVSGLPFSGPDSYNSSYQASLSYQVNAGLAFAPKAAKAQRAASEADITSSAENVRAVVTQQYISALQSQAAAAVLDTLVDVAEGQLNLAKAKMAAGAGTIIDVRTAEVAVGQAQVAALTMHNQAQLDRLRLYQTMGVPGDVNANLTTTFSLAKPTFSLDSVLDLARRVNPDVAARKSRLVAAEASVKLAKTLYLPSLNLSTGYAAQAFGYKSADLLAAQESARAASNFKSCMERDSLRIGAGLKPVPCGTGVLSDQQLQQVREGNQPFKFNKAPYSVGAFISIPIFNNFQREAQVEQQRVTRDNAMNDVRARNLQLTTDVTQAYLTLVTQSKTVELQTQIAARAAEDLALNEASFRVGARTFLDVTTARGTFEKAQIDRVNSIYEYHKAFAALENAVGRPLR
jgi:outer membrane protein